MQCVCQYGYRMGAVCLTSPSFKSLNAPSSCPRVSSVSKETSGGVQSALVSQMKGANKGYLVNLFSYLFIHQVTTVHGNILASVRRHLKSSYQDERSWS